MADDASKDVAGILGLDDDGMTLAAFTYLTSLVGARTLGCIIHHDASQMCVPLVTRTTI